MKINISRYLPMGMEKKTFLSPLWGGFCGLILFNGINFLFRYSDARAMLFWKNGAERTIKEGAIMVDYIQLIRGIFGGLAAAILFMLGFALYFYFYHRQGSRSIYLMRRLPDRWELHRRCLAAPFTGIVLYVAATFTLILLTFAIYMLATPSECLTAGQWGKIWAGLF